MKLKKYIRFVDSKFYVWLTTKRVKGFTIIEKKGFYYIRSIDVVGTIAYPNEKEALKGIVRITNNVLKEIDIADSKKQKR